MERVKRWKEKVMGCGRYYRIGSYCAASLLLTGCTTLKKAGIVALGAGAGATAGTVLSGGVAAPILGATITASVTDVVTEVTSTGSKNMSDCAPDNFWTLLGSLIEMGGWALILIVIVPMVFSWLMPGPIQFKGRKKNGS